MDELVECVLPVRPRLAPDHGARRVVDALPGAGHVPEQDHISYDWFENTLVIVYKGQNSV